MDSLSIIASVAGLITLTQSVTKYSTAVKGAPAEIKRLIGELESLSTILAEIKVALEEKDKNGEVRARL